MYASSVTHVRRSAWMTPTTTTSADSPTQACNWLGGPAGRGSGVRSVTSSEGQSCHRASSREGGIRAPGPLNARNTIDDNDMGAQGRSSRPWVHGRHQPSPGDFLLDAAVRNLRNSVLRGVGLDPLAPIPPDPQG